MQNIYDRKNISSSKYYNTDKMYNIKIPHKSKSLSLFHVNACSLIKILMTFNIFSVALKKVLT